jgi:hypothetical protein
MMLVFPGVIGHLSLQIIEVELRDSFAKVMKWMPRDRDDTRRGRPSTYVGSEMSEKIPERIRIEDPAKCYSEMD